MGLADETGGLFRFSAKWVDKTLGREARRRSVEQPTNLELVFNFGKGSKAFSSPAPPGRGESMETIPIDRPSWHDAGSCVHRAPTRRLLAGAY